MGQRHQLYLIARVIPHGSTDDRPYYCSIGGWHHQWCYGTLPLRAALRTINLLKNPINAKIVAAEIENLHHKYSRTDTEGANAIPENPCPYTLSLAATAFSIDLESCYIRDGTFTGCSLSSQCGCWDIDNNDGLTIIDVTNPSEPAYAFVPGDERSGGRGASPVCAKAYLHDYYDIRSDEAGLGEEQRERQRDMKRLISDMSEVPFLTEDLLAEAWPKEFSSTKSTKDQRKGTPKILAKNLPVEEEQRVGVSSLADLTIAPAVSRSIELGDTTELELLLPARAAQIRDALRNLGPKLVPFPDAGVTLLSKVIHNDHSIDLSPFSLTTSQLATLASTFPESGRIEAVILSHSPNVTVEHLRVLLETKPDINRIELVNTGINMKDMQAFLETSSQLFRRVSDVILYPDFLISSVPHPGAFNVLLDEGPSVIMVGDGKAEGILPISFWTPDKIVRNLVDVMGLFVRVEYCTRQLKGIPMQACLATGYREGVAESIAWGKRSITTFPDYHPADTVSPGAWCFVLEKLSAFMPIARDDQGGPKYAFAKLVSNEPNKFHVFSFRDFLKEMEKEGRGPLPPDDVVDKLDSILAGNDQGVQDISAMFNRMGRDGAKGWALFAEEELTRLFVSVPQRPRGDFFLQVN